MSNDFKRTDRIAELIQQNLAQIIQQHMRDPRLPTIINISQVKVAPDLSHARIYFTLLNDTDIEPTKKILNGASGFLKTILAKVVKLRIVPKLHFVYDKSAAYTRHLLYLIDKANPEPSNFSSDQNSSEQNADEDSQDNKNTPDSDNSSVIND